MSLGVTGTYKLLCIKKCFWFAVQSKINQVVGFSVTKSFAKIGQLYFKLLQC